MPSFIVKQPNSLYAMFSTVVDDFTSMDMSREEALEECRRLPGMGVVESEAKVRRAEQEEACAMGSVVTSTAGPPFRLTRTALVGLRTSAYRQSMIERALLIAVVCIGVIVGAGMVGRGVRHALCDVAGALSPTPIICDGGAR